jgi:transcriptional regulator with XRE-family HTH domain
LVRDLGWEQQAIAKRLKVPNSAVSQWATGRRPIPRRHLSNFLTLVIELIREHDPTHREAILSAIRLWQIELFISVGACASHVQNSLKVLKSPYAQDDILKIDREERRRLRRACDLLEHYLGILDQFEQGMLEPKLRQEAINRQETPEEFISRLRSPAWYGMDEAEEE